MAGPPEAFAALERLRFVADGEVLDALELQLEDLDDRETRALVTRHEHRERAEALDAGPEEDAPPDERKQARRRVRAARRRNRRPR